MSRKSLRSFFLILATVGWIESDAAVPSRRILTESLAPVSQAGDPTRPHVSRTMLSVDERAANIDLVISLAMRDYAAFAARISSGGRISQAEMEEKYLPDRADHDRVRDWALRQGFTETLVDSNHTNIFVRGTVDQAAAAFQVEFARVATTEGEFTSAISAPSLPAEIAGPILHVEGLQQHIRQHPRLAAAVPVQVSNYATAADVLAAYNVPANLTGSGQTIAIFGWSTVTLSDLTSFWNAVGSPQSVANVTIVNALTAGGTDPSDIDETTMDAEWSGAIASGAKLRIYNEASPENFSALINAANQILNDAKTDPTISVFSHSGSAPEELFSTNGPPSYTQTFGQLAAAGISMVASSGDGGSNPRTDGVLGYLASAPLSPEYPASDPNVTSIGGTNLTFTGVTWTKTDEAAWNDTYNGSTYASGGGYSARWAKPSWQNVGASTILTKATSRCVPDVAACSVWGSGSYAFYGITGGKISGASGTSLAAPVFGGVTAVINQARKAVGEPSLGLLTPWLYPLAGTSSFNSITSGNNGTYSAGPIYNLCTGLGSPNVANLVSTLAGGGSVLSNMSVRTNLNTAQSLTVGFVTTGPKSLLVRAIGPGLNTVFGLTGFYADPNFSLVSQGVTIDQNDDWSASLAPTFTKLGAFPLVSGSKDSALLRTISGAATAEVSGTGSGVMLVELYDADSAGASNRLTNVSARNQAGTGSNILISGFVISGLLPRPLLIRGIGPGLHDVFGITGNLTDPVLEIHQTVNGVDTVVASNDNWDSSLTAVFDRVGAYHLTPGSKDAALSITLPPGVYTAQVSGANSGTGDGVVEIYEVP